MAVFKRGQSSIMEWLCHATSNVCECRWVFKYQDDHCLILDNIVNTFSVIQSLLTEKKGSDLSAIIDWLIERIKEHSVQYEIRRDEQQLRSSLQRFLTHLDVVALNYSQIGSWELQNSPPDNFLKLVQSLVECAGMENPVVDAHGGAGS